MNKKKGVIFSSLQLSKIWFPFQKFFSWYNCLFYFCLFCFKKLDDTVGPVRDSAAEAIGTAMKVVGERGMGAYLDGLDKIKQDKVRF